MSADPLPGPSPATIAEVSFAVLLLLAGTLGPIYRLSLEMGGSGINFAEDPRVIVVFATLYLTAGVLGARAHRAVRWEPLVASGALCVLLVASTLWSLDRSLTGVQATLALATLAVPWYLARRFGPRQIVVMAWFATTLGLGLSALMLIAGDALARDSNGRWAGIYFNRNSLGTVAGLCVVLGAVVALQSWQSDPARFHRPLAVAAMLSVPPAAVCLWQSGSRTSLVAALGTLVAWSASSLVRYRLPRSGRAGIWSVQILGGLAVVVLFGPGSRLLGSDSTLQGRTQIWGYLRSRVLERPFTGDGWLASYGTYDFWAFSRDNLSHPVQSAHNGFVEVAAGAGVLALLVLLVVVWMGLDRGVNALASRDVPWGGALAVGVYFVLANGAESFIGAHHLIWVLFLSVCVFGWRSSPPEPLRESPGVRAAL